MANNVITWVADIIAFGGLALLVISIALSGRTIGGLNDRGVILLFALTLITASGFGLKGVLA